MSRIGRAITLIAATAALAPGGARAQAPGGAHPALPAVNPPSSLSSPTWMASDIYRADVYDRAETKIGTVSDLVMDRSGQVETAIIGVGGFLGVGQKDVAVPFKDLTVGSRAGADWLVLDRTRDDLARAPAFDKATRAPKD